MTDSYGEIFSDMIDKQARYDDRGTIFRKLDISRNQFYNVTNPDRLTSAGNPYPFPTSWGVRATNAFKDYSWVKTVVKDCGGIFISPEDIKELRATNSGNVKQTLNLFNKILGLVKK